MTRRNPDCPGERRPAGGGGRKGPSPLPVGGARVRGRAWLGGLLALAWATALGAGERVEVPREELLAGAPLVAVAGVAPPLAGAEVLAVSAEMRAFLDERVHRRAAAPVRMRELVDALVNRASDRLEFEEQTRTAAETFRARRGNCLSFSNLFVALAREVGLDARFQEVDIPPDWRLQDDLFVLNRHVNVRVDLRSGGEQVVDFNVDDFRASYDTRVISDARALAHYHNNLGVERMQAGELASAFVSFRTALTECDRRFSPAWTNLGTLYSRLGHPAHAESAYRQALQADAGDLVAMSNLANLLERQGEPELAAAYRRRVTDHRNQNPYYRYQLARAALAAGDLDAAIGHLRFAIRRKRNEDEFYALLGVCYHRQGDDRAARRWLAKAEEVASSAQQKRRYSSKLEALLAGSR